MVGKVSDLLSAAVVVGAASGKTSPPVREGAGYGSAATKAAAVTEAKITAATPAVDLKEITEMRNKMARERMTMIGAEPVVHRTRNPVPLEPQAPVSVPPVSVGEGQDSIAAERRAQEQQRMDQAAVRKMTEELNKLMSKINCDLRFNYHKEADMMSVQMIDKNTREVLKELPPEEMVQNMINTRDWIGAFLDKKI